MTSTIRIQAREAKEGMLSKGRRINSVKQHFNGVSIHFGEGTDVQFFPDRVQPLTIAVELEETHPIAVLERQIARVEQQRRLNHAEWLEAIRELDEPRKHRREVDASLLRGKAWGLQYAVNELRAGVEYYPGKGGQQ